jgi:16S rRNA (cytosine1402-N4)-methyltransferase
VLGLRPAVRLSQPVPDPGISERHRPVLIGEVVDALAPSAGRRFLDCTLGLGGHSEALLEAGADVVGVDRDPNARALAQERLARFGDRLRIIGGTFAEAVEMAVNAGEHYDGVLADLGVSSMQLDDPERGFGIASGADADMRMGDGCPLTALDLIDETDEEDLANLIHRYGEERMSRRVARALKRGRSEGRVTSAADIAQVVRSAIPGHHPRHPALRTFQALRIVVNDELGQLDRLLAGLPKVVADGGTAVVISFHSLEDRAAKFALRDQKAAGQWIAISKKVVTATDAELAINPRSHSAKLRWARRAPASNPLTSSGVPS